MAASSTARSRDRLVSKSEARFVAPLTVRIAVVGEVQPYLREA
jgi:hypothetical protein